MAGWTRRQALKGMGATGLAMTGPSLSPENPHPPDASLVAGPARDPQILGLNTSFRDQGRRTWARLTPDRIGRVRQLQEGQQDCDMQVPEIHRRHVSHLYAVYPSGQIDRVDTPELAAAA